MATKTSGAEIKAFYRDDAYWPDDKDGNVWHDDLLLEVNGTESDDVNIDELQSSDQVKIVDGYILSHGVYKVDCSFESYFKKWRKEQNTAFISAKVPKDKLDAVKAAIKAAGGTVL